VLEAIGIADRDHQLAGAQGLRLPEGHGGQIGSGDLQHCHVGIRILTDQIGGSLPAVRQHHLDVRRLLDHVAVGENQPVGGEDESRAGAGLRRRTASWAGSSLPNVHRHHRRCHQLDRTGDGAGIGVEQVVIGKRREGLGHGLCW
jgi:hypothetical protein